jgi:hypothetical protein
VRSVPRLLLAFLLLLGPGLVGALPAHAQDDDGAYDAGDYDEAPGPDDEAPDPRALAPYGSWVDGGDYGRVWRPSVTVGWAPYVDGYWAWTPYGWTWVSYEPWAWTFHYGRWALLPVGWVWVPGTVWGPAWVDWYWGAGFVGWAPLSPFGTHVTVINQFVFVHERDFCSRRLARTVVDHHLVPNDVVHRWQHRDATHERAPGLHHIERVSARPVLHVDHKPPGTLAPRRIDRRPQLARPGVDPGLGAARRGVARLGHPWQPGGTAQVPSQAGRAPDVRRPPLVDDGGRIPRVPRLARPQAQPRLGGARGDVRGRPTQWGAPSRLGAVARPPMRRADAAAPGGMRAAPPAVPGGSLRMPAPSLLGARGAAPGSRLGSASGRQAHGGTGGLRGQQLSGGAIVR